MRRSTFPFPLVHEPKPKNPRLAAACKRIGLVEQTGRGVDKIYMGQLRYDRPVPDYTRSDSTGVRVIIRGGKPSLDFSAFVFEQEDQGKKLELDDLLILNALFHERRIDVKSACTLIQKGITETKSALERLLERGLVEPRGERQARTYHLSGMVYKRLNMEAEYIRAKGFEPHQHEQMVLDYVRKMGRITRSEAADMCHLSGDQASRLLRRISMKYEYFQMVGHARALIISGLSPGSRLVMRGMPESYTRLNPLIFACILSAGMAVRERRCSSRFPKDSRRWCEKSSGPVTSERYRRQSVRHGGGVRRVGFGFW